MAKIIQARLMSAEDQIYTALGPVVRVFDTNDAGELIEIPHERVERFEGYSFALKRFPAGQVWVEIQGVPVKRDEIPADMARGIFDVWEKAVIDHADLQQRLSQLVWAVQANAKLEAQGSEQRWGMPEGEMPHTKAIGKVFRAVSGDDHRVDTVSTKGFGLGKYDPPGQRLGGNVDEEA